MLFYSNVHAEKAVLRGQGIELQICYEPNGIIEKVLSLNGCKIDALGGTAWRITSGDKNFTDENVELAAGDANRVVLRGNNSVFKWELEYRLDGQDRIIKGLSLAALKDTAIDKISLFNMSSTVSPAVAKTELQDIAAFYSFQDSALFASLDFPYSRITTEEGITAVSYPPFIKLGKGRRYQCHTLTIGSARLQKHVRYQFDDGIVDAMDSYIQQRFSPRFNKPIFMSCSINNRHTQPQGRDIFYTWKDHPELRFNQDLLKEEVALMPKLGIEYYQVFPGVFDWTPQDPDPNFVHEFIKFAQSNHVNVGDYSGCNGLFINHYNTYRNFLKKPQWELTDKNGAAAHGNFCFGNPEFVKFYKETVVDNCKKYDFKLHCLDFLRITPCYAKDHNHPVGEESVYSQIKGLTDLMEAINEVSPDMVIWPNSGDWGRLLPKLAWWAPNLYLSDPGVSSPWQGLNQTRLLDDARREQMVGLHYTHFLPYRFFSNFQYFCSRDLHRPGHPQLPVWGVVHMGGIA